MKIGVDLGGTNMRVGLVCGEEVIRKEVVPSPSQAPEEEGLKQLQELIDRVITPEVTSIGIGVPSVVDSQLGIVYNVANIPSWREVALKELLEKRYGLPTYVNNDSNCFTWGVKRFGEGRSYRNLVGITLGTGVGAGVIIHDQLYGGPNTGAGEVGSLPYLQYDFEHYCSSGFFVRYYDMSGAEAAERASAGDPEALSIWKVFGGHLGELIKAVLFVYDPQAIVLGGGIASAYPFYEASMRKAMASFPYPSVVNRLEIIVSEKKDVALLGASALAETIL